jgi:antitoxin component of MazEF toxin-antitoxin module
MVVQTNPRKIVQTGSSLAVTIPPEVLDEMDLEKGDRVVIEADTEQAVLEAVEWTKA